MTKQNERNSVLPFLSLNEYITEYTGKQLASLIADTCQLDKTFPKCIPVENTMRRVDVQLDEVNFIVSKDRIIQKNKLNETEASETNSPLKLQPSDRGLGEEPEKKAGMMESSIVASNPYTKIKVQNCGRGSAVNLRCHFYQQAHIGDDKFDIYTRPFTVPCSNAFDLGICLDLGQQFSGEYILALTYYDIYANHYIQEIPITVSDETYDLCIDISQPQKLVIKKDGECNA